MQRRLAEANPAATDISVNCVRSSSMPKRSGTVATTIVLNSTLGPSGAGTSTIVVSATAWLFTQKSATKIETAPKTAAMPIMVTALPLTPLNPCMPGISCS